MNIFAPYAKAWTAAFLAVAYGFVQQFFGTGEGPSPDQVGALTEQSSGILSVAIQFVVMWVGTYLIPNKAPE